MFIDMKLIEVEGSQGLFFMKTEYTYRHVTVSCKLS